MSSDLNFNSCLIISKDANGERIVEASKDIAKGTLLFCSYPVLISPESDCLNSVCNYCYRQFTSLYRCSKCRLVRYCSKECQKADWKIHRLECPYFLKLAEMEEKHSTCNLLIEMLMIRLLRAIASNGVIQDFSSLPLAETRNSCLFKSSINDLQVILKRQYEPSPSVKSECDLVCSVYCFTLIIINRDNSLPSDISTLSSCYYLLKQNLIDVISFHKSIAKGVYFPLPCILTYDIPNTMYYFEDNLLYVIASTDIEKGSFISFSYIPYYLPSLLKRTLYNDRCLSLHSLSNQSSFNELMTMKCPNGHEQPLDFDSIKKSNKKEMICSICQTTFTIPFLIKNKDDFIYSPSLDLYDMNRDYDIPPNKISQMYEKTYGEDNYILYLLYNKIRDHYIGLQNYQDALPFCYKVINYEEKYLLDQQYSLINDYLILLTTLSKLSLWDDTNLILDKIQILLIDSYCISEKERQYIKQYLIQIKRCGDVSDCMNS